jgi:pimeloyl-ACP methyl ester carboxylesterase
MTQKVFVGGHPMAYRRAGRGEPVLLVHGIFAHSFIWKEVQPRLADGYDTIAIDLLGCGDSTMPLSLSLSLEAQADHLAELVQWMGLGKVHFVGHEVGGGIGQVFAARHPRLLRSLTLVNSVAGDLWPVFPTSALRAALLGQLVLSALDAGLSSWIVRRALVHKEKVTGDLMWEFHRPLQTLAGRNALRLFARSLDPAQLVAVEPDLRKLALPVQLVWGARDRVLPAETLDRLRTVFSTASVHRLDGVGHLVPVDAPERLAEILLERLGAAAPPAP